MYAQSWLYMSNKKTHISVYAKPLTHIAVYV